MNTLTHQYINCPICKNLIFHKHLQIHYKICKEANDERIIREEIIKQTHPYYIFMENQKRVEELKKAIPVLDPKVMKKNINYENEQNNRSEENPYYEDNQRDKKKEIKEENKKVVENMLNNIFSNHSDSSSFLNPLNKNINNDNKTNKKEESSYKNKENIKILKDNEHIKKNNNDSEIFKKEDDIEKKNMENQTSKNEKIKKKEKHNNNENEINDKKKEDSEKRSNQILTVENYKPPNLSLSTSLMTEQLMNHFFALYDKLFYDYVKDKSIALVGPAESVLNTNRGSIIDKFDLTVRLNKSIPLPANLSKDIGTKTHILYNSLNTTDFPGENKLSPTLHKKYGIQFVCSSYPFNHSVFQEDIARYVRKYKFELPFKVMDDNKFRKFEMALGTRPYTGTCAIMDLLSYPIKILYITGLDFYYSKYYSQYREISKGQLKHTRNSNIHNAKPQLNYLRHISLLDDRIVLDNFLNKILYEDYDKVYKNLKNIKLYNIYGYQNQVVKDYMESKDFYLTFTKYQKIDIPYDKKDRNNIVITNNSWFVADELQFIFIISQSQTELKKVIMEKKNHPNKYFGNFYYAQQSSRDIPSIFLQSKYLMEIKNILLRLNIKNPTLTLLTFISFGIHFPDNHYFYENEFLSYFTNMDEKKLVKYLIRRKFFKIIKNSNN